MAKKKIIIGALAASILAAGLVAGAAWTNRDSIREGHGKIMKIIKGVLTPEQFQTLMDFHKSHRAEREQWINHRQDPAAIYQQLALTEDQQDQLIDVVASNIDDLAPKLDAARAAGVKVKDAVMVGDPENPDLASRSRELGSRLGDVAVMLSTMAADARGLLTTDQIAVLEAQRADHEKFETGQLNRLPERADELVNLWQKLALTPQQVDALEEISDVMPAIMRKHHRAGRKEFHEDLKGILTPDQLATIRDFRQDNRPEFRARRAEHREMREKLRAELNITGDQKIALVNAILKHKDDLVPSVMLLAGAGMDLHDKVLADNPDETSIRLAADQLGENIALVAGQLASVCADAKNILSPAQWDTIVAVAGEHDNMLAKRVSELPARVHGLITLLDRLDLTPAQKDAIVDLIEQKHQERRERFKDWHESR